jgi:periplasmic divalent cation tolerance protein
MLIVLTTTPNMAEAETLAMKIVHAKLGACVQILPQMTSIYFWQGKVQREPEHLLMIKTIPERFSELREFIVSNHSYDTPEITAIDADRVSERYNTWVSNYLT